MERTELKLKHTSRQKKPITETRQKGGFCHLDYCKNIYMKKVHSRTDKIPVGVFVHLSLYN
jgi:hypothetical protein